MAQQTNIGILGAEGRMGQALLHEVKAHPSAVLTAALTSSTSANIGKAYGSTNLSTDIRAALNICDVLIDFSHPKAAIDAALMMYNAPCQTFITGTTGYSKPEEAALVAAAEAITLVKSGNFSIGVCLLESLTQTAAKTLGVGWDASVLDIHHHDKKDAPSGTALMLGRAIKSGQKASGVKQKTEYAAQRLGGVIGEHHVSLANELETITLSHKANNRSVFAAGALAAALWATSKPKGLYKMKDVLGL